MHAVPGTPAPLVAAAAVDGRGRGQGRRAAESINADEPWRNQQPKPGPSQPLQLATPASATLPNGLTLILSEKHDVPIVAANLVFRGGSDSNPPDKPGLANFAAAMLDEGTSTRNALAIADQLARLGASLGTGSSMDCDDGVGAVAGQELSGDARSGGRRHAAPVVPGRRNRAAARPAAGAAGAAARQPGGARRHDRDAARSTAASHPYGFSEIGTEASVKAITRADMQAFWKERFVPNNAALVVAGDITMAELRALAEKAFGAWERGTPDAAAARRADDDRGARGDRRQARAARRRSCASPAIGAERSSPDFRPLQVMNQALGGSFSSRINMNLREAHGYTYGAQSQFTFRRAPGPFQVAAGVRTDVTAPAVAEVFKEVLSMAQKPMTADELQRAKDSMAYSLPGAFESSANAVNNFSNVFTYDLGLDYYSRYAAQVNAVTIDQAAAVARKYLVPEKMVVIAVGDRSKIEIPLRELGSGPVEIWDADGKKVN